MQYTQSNKSDIVTTVGRGIFTTSSNS